jgi:hypothetical protein
MTCSNSKKGEYPCLYPGCNSKQTIFGRPADIERHYQTAHKCRERDKYWCDYAECHRVSDPYSRKHHFRDHLIQYHKEDIWSRGSSNSLSKDAYQGHNERLLWQAGRYIDDVWWRCARCLIRCYIAKDGWVCPNCRSSCEEDRILARGMPPPSFQKEALNDDAVSRTPDTWLVREINSVGRSISIVGHAMETLWLKMEMVLGCTAQNVREMFTRRSRQIPQPIDISKFISLGPSEFTWTKVLD